MAEVFLARRRVGGVEKRLVVKRLRRDHQRDPRFLEMFVREAQLSMSLVHNNIVPVFDFGRIGDDVFLAMEHIDGKDLGSSLARSRKLGAPGMPPLLAAFVAHECSEALDHAHRRPDGVTHRDVTPRNVLLSRAGEVKLTDFGIAAVVGEVAGSFGTPGYMAPEQANNLRCDARVDVYALGIVLWESLIGVHVRPTSDRQATLDAARSGELPALADTIPAPLAAIIERATTRAPDERLASAREMAAALDAYIVAERGRAGGASPAKQLAEWLRATWADAPDDDDDEAPVVQGGFVTFLDDGADEVRGTHTLRSAAETAGDEPAVPPAPAEPAPPPAPTTEAAPRRRLAVIVAVVLVLAGLAAIVARGFGSASTSPPHDAAVPIDTAAVLADVAVAVDAALADAAVAIDAAIDAPPRLRPDAAAKPIDAAPITASIDAAAPLGTIIVGAQPWAYIYVDDASDKLQTPQTLRLAVGPHRIRFENPELKVSRTVTVDVPAEGVGRHVENMR
jgi:hypothetical protein